MYDIMDAYNASFVVYFVLLILVGPMFTLLLFKVSYPCVDACLDACVYGEELSGMDVGGSTRAHVWQPDAQFHLLVKTCTYQYVCMSSCMHIHIHIQTCICTCRADACPAAGQGGPRQLSHQTRGTLCQGFSFTQLPCVLPLSRHPSPKPQTLNPKP